MNLENKQSAVFRAGVGRAVITPPIGTILYGYAPGRPAESIHDDLTVTAFAFEKAGIRAMLLSVTLCAMSEALCIRMQQAIERETGFPAGHTVIGCTHTHSGPNTSIESAWGKVDYGYIENILVPGILEAARKAARTLQPAALGIGTVHSDVGVNRRELHTNGRIGLGQNPWGAYDPTMTVVSLRGRDGIIGNMIHYCAHCTASGCNPEVTRDWAGPMIDRLEAESGGVTAFIAGAEGNTGPRLPNGRTTGNLQLALELGSRAGIDAVNAWRTIREWRDPTLAAVQGTLRIPNKQPPAQDWVQAQLERLGSAEKLTGEKRYMEVNEYRRYERILAMYESGEPFPDETSLPQTLIALGPVLFVPFMFEMFVEISLRLRRASPYAYTLCLANANGSRAYLPTREAISRGGYEVESFYTRETLRLVDDADTCFVQENLRLIDSIQA